MRRVRSASNLNAINLAVAAASVFDQVSTLVSFPPLSAASSILLGILKCIETLRDNKDRCARLASRCALFLRLIANNMQDRIEAPESLLRNIKDFEGMLTQLKNDMESLAAGRFHQRFLRNKAIEDALEEYNTMLDDALQSFHTVSLMEIQRALGDLRVQVNGIASSTAVEKRLDDVTIRPAAIVSHVGASVARPTENKEHQRRMFLAVQKPVSRSSSAEPMGKAAPRRIHSNNTVLLFCAQDRPYYEFTNSAVYAIEYQAKIYPSSQHLYQARKFMDVDSELAEQIRTMPDAKQAREHATRFRSLQRHEWTITERITVMEEVVLLKFMQHPFLRQQLLGTNGQTLVFDCPTDAFWGCGPDGQGQNELGNILTRVRERFRADRALLEPVRMQHSSQAPSSPPSCDGTLRAPILFTTDPEYYGEFHPTSPHAITYRGKFYSTAEHLYHAWKFFDTESPELADHIRYQPTAAAAASVAVSLQSKQRGDWLGIRLAVMETILEAKFTQHSALRALLLSTQDRQLIYNWAGHPIWGVGPDGKGQNELGQTLMRLRQRFRAPEKHAMNARTEKHS
ncbi:NADAR family protein [Phanerochaete sordida]|uniref:NADAR family protein n=1 Tax=Phanerochaete sordida TaxID=48140 RepID=A0A9P3GIT0_9APHY|nr:NADAR family protein [Phanerochaete sordida]